MYLEVLRPDRLGAQYRQHLPDTTRPASIPHAWADVKSHSTGPDICPFQYIISIFAARPECLRIQDIWIGTVRQGLGLCNSFTGAQF